MSSERKELGPPPVPDTVFQDGVPCSRTAPWSEAVGKRTTLAFLPLILLGVGTLAMTSIPKLALWLALFGVFAYPLRYLVCARCPYYGQNCSTGFGKMVPRMFRKQEGRSMRLGLWLDVVILTVLFLLPLPETWQLGGALLTLLWAGAFALLGGVVTRMACSVCPLTFCPIGRAGKVIWGR